MTSSDNTPQRIAEGLVDNLCECAEYTRDERKARIAAALVEYGEQEYIEGLEQGHSDALKELDSQYFLGWKRALEEAAKIADIADADDASGHWIANQIRALMEKDAKEKK